MSAATFADLNALAAHLRTELATKKFILLYAYNGTGKTRLSTAFKDLGKKRETTPLTTAAGEHLVTTAGDQIEAETIKVSRGEENIFIWCFFLAIVQLALDGAEAYRWVKYVYIDDPVSSLDEHNAITVASNLAQLLKKEDSTLKTVISTHHTLFFNVLCNELGRANKYFL